MTEVSTLAQQLQEQFADKIIAHRIAVGELTIEVSPHDCHGILLALRDTQQFNFVQLIDVCGVDYLTYGKDEWKTDQATNSGFSRGVEGREVRDDCFADANLPDPNRRFAVVYHLLSLKHNHRLRVKTFTTEDPPIVDSVVDIWPVANWFEREAFDLFGILFRSHPDLRRLLTDYGFMGHPFRKDFPLSGHVEVRYDPEQKRVIYQPITIEPRILVPKVIRDDHRYLIEQEKGDVHGGN